MNKTLFSTAIALSLSLPANANEIWGCPSGNDARDALASGEIKNWPNYSEADGMRVQLQHPDTALIAQSKLVKSKDRSVGVCQYYNHIGLTISFAVLDLEKADLKSKGYWRKEYTESRPEQDRPGQEMIEVCMQKKKGLASPSVECPFNIPSSK